MSKGLFFLVRSPVFLLRGMEYQERTSLPPPPPPSNMQKHASCTLICHNVKRGLSTSIVDLRFSSDFSDDWHQGTSWRCCRGKKRSNGWDPSFPPAPRSFSTCSVFGWRPSTHPRFIVELDLSRSKQLDYFEDPRLQRWLYLRADQASFYWRMKNCDNLKQEQCEAVKLCHVIS